MGNSLSPSGRVTPSNDIPSNDLSSDYNAEAPSETQRPVVRVIVPPPSASTVFAPAADGRKNKVKKLKTKNKKVKSKSKNKKSKSKSKNKSKSKSKSKNKKVKSKSKTKSKKMSVKKTIEQCKKELQKKIRINMNEYKSGKYKSPKQAIAVSYSQIKKKYPSCKKYFDK